VFIDEETVAANLCIFIVEEARRAIDSRGVFTVGLSGGSAAKYLCQHLPDLKTDWSKWHVFFCDERHVQSDDPESTFGFYSRNLFSHVPISTDHIFTDNVDVPVEEAAVVYARKMKSVFGDVPVPKFDLLLLGMGPDGHTCSLFPGHELLEENKQWVAAVLDSPKPPAQRITMTFPVLLNARCAIFVACGVGKADMVKRVIEGTDDPPLPAARVKPHDGQVVWFLDEPAANKLAH
jgi:6-phosphogluconolactonase